MEFPGFSGTLPIPLPLLELRSRARKTPVYFFTRAFLSLLPPAVKSYRRDTWLAPSPYLLPASVDESTEPVAIRRCLDVLDALPHWQFDPLPARTGHRAGSPKVSSAALEQER